MTANQAQIPSGSPVAEPMYLVDASGNPYSASGGGSGGAVNIADPNTPTNKAAVDGTGALKVAATFSAASVGINDGSNSSLKATVGPFHSSDNQGTSGIANALFSAGIAQILNPAGTIDRQRGTGVDGIPAVGVATGTQQLAGPQLSTTFGAAVTGNASVQSVQVASTASLKVGDIVTTSDNVESVEITAITDATHASGIFTKNHGNGASLTWFHYNQARDASVGDNVVGAGLSPSATFLYNNVSGNFEYDRSANGEKDGANGFGTAVAAEYEWNGGGPYNGSAPSGLQFDRARNLQGKGLGSGSIANNPLAVGSNSLTLNAAPTTLLPGQQILIDRAGANPEVGYVGAGYTAGSTSVPLQSVTAFSHAQNATVEWDQFSALGPGLSGFTAAGVGIEEEALYNPVDGKFYIERSATQDAMSGANIVAESPALWNGATFDRLSGLNGAANFQDWLRYLILKGQGFTASTGKLTSPATANQTLAAAIVAPANATKNILIYSIKFGNNGGANTHTLNYLNSDPALGSTMTIQNGILGGGLSSVATLEYINTTQTPTGSIIDMLSLASNTPGEYLTNNGYLLLPKSTANANAVIVYPFIGTASSIWWVTFKWVEF